MRWRDEQLDRLQAMRALRLPLRALAQLYGDGARLYHRTRQLRVPHRASVPVISIGAAHAGGVGKTPITAYLARLLLEWGFEPAILSRGYGGRRPKSGVKGLEGHEDPAQWGDEPLMLARALGGAPRGPHVYVAANRGLAAQAAEAGGAEVILLDDGHQHHTLHKDLSILILPAETHALRDQVIPAGRLREPLPEAISRADLVWRHGLGDSSGLTGPSHANVDLRSRWKPLGIRSWKDSRLYPLKRLLEGPFGLYTSLARPERVVDGLAHALGQRPRILWWRQDADHAHLHLGAWQAMLQQAAGAGVQRLLLTQKDAVKLPRGLQTDLAIWVLEGEVEVMSGREILERHLMDLLQSYASCTTHQPGAGRA